MLTNAALGLGLLAVIMVAVFTLQNQEQEQEHLDRITARYNAQLSPYYAAARLWVDGVIDPVDTRDAISMGIEAANHAPIKEKFNVGVIQT